MCPSQPVMERPWPRPMTGSGGALPCDGNQRRFTPFALPVLTAPGSAVRRGRTALGTLLFVEAPGGHAIGHGFIFHFIAVAAAVQLVILACSRSRHFVASVSSTVGHIYLLDGLCKGVGMLSNGRTPAD